MMQRRIRTSSAPLSRRRTTHWRPAGALLTLTLLVSTPLQAAPLPAPAEFPPDFPAIADSEHGFRLGGFGGATGSAPSHAPVIFVHGNTGDACNWKLVRDDFRAAGWNDQALWALSYNGIGSGLGDAPARPDPRCAEERAAAGGDGTRHITSNEANIADLQAFIQAVRLYTGSARFSLVAHSLGVTLARRTLQAEPALRDDLVAFVGIAGGNDGTSLCPEKLQQVLPVCAELAAGGSPWLDRLNGPGGTDETWAPARWMTIFDGSGKADIAYIGDLADSPALAGADNRRFVGTSHNDLRVRPDIVASYRVFIEQADRARRQRDWRRERLIGK